MISSRREYQRNYRLMIGKKALVMLNEGRRLTYIRTKLCPEYSRGWLAMALLDAMKGEEPTRNPLLD